MVLRVLVVYNLYIGTLCHLSLLKPHSTFLCHAGVVRPIVAQ